MKITGGKWMGIMIFILLIIFLLTTFILEMFNIKDDIQKLIDLCEIAFRILVVVWGVVFGSGITKKIVSKGIKNEESNNNS